MFHAWGTGGIGKWCPQMVAGRKKRFKKKCKLEVGWEEGMLRKDNEMGSRMGGRKVRKIRS